MIERFFEENSIEFEKLPENEILKSWALRLKSETKFGSAFFDRRKGNLLKIAVAAIMGGALGGALVFATISSNKYQHLEDLMIVCIILALLGFIIGFAMTKEFLSDAKAKYENRRFYSVVNNGDEKIKSKFNEYFEDIEIYVSGFERRANKDKLVFIVLQGETIEKTAILIVTEETLLTRPKAPISFRPMFYKKLYGSYCESERIVGLDSRNFLR